MAICCSRRLPWNGKAHAWYIQCMGYMFWHVTSASDPNWKYIKSSWWFQPIWKILVKLGIFPNFRGENKTSSKPPPRHTLLHTTKTTSCELTNPWNMDHFKMCRLNNMDKCGVFVTVMLLFLLDFSGFEKVWSLSKFYSPYRKNMLQWLIFMVNVGKYTSPMNPMGCTHHDGKIFFSRHAIHVLKFQKACSEPTFSKMESNPESEGVSRWCRT